MSSISIIIPVYNAEKYLKKCVDSVLAQTFTDYTVVLVDDGSSDASYKICEEYSVKYANVITIHKENGGAASARNVGIDYVVKNRISDYIGFIDSDDFVHPQMYQILYELIKDSNADMSAIHYQFTEPLSDIPYTQYGMEEYLKYDLLSCKELLYNFNEIHRVVSMISPCMKLYKTELFDTIRFREGYIEEDSVLLPKLLEKADYIARIKLPLYFWTVREGSVTRSGFNGNSFAFLRVSYENALFFEQTGIDSQKKFYRKQFMNRCVRFSLMIAKHKEFKNHLTEYRNIYNKEFSRFLPSCDFSKAEYLMHILFRLHLPFAGSIYKKMYPDYETVF